MDRLTHLLDEARRAGLTLSIGANGRLVIQGPKSAEAVARRLIEHKADVVAMLTAQPDTDRGWLKRLLDTLAAAGARLQLIEGRSVVEPPDRATPEALATVRHWQTELVEALKIEAAAGDPDWAKVVRPDGGTSWFRRGYEDATADLDDAEPEESGNAACRCGSTAWRDIPVHEGQSTRRDCARCGRFIGFSVWYGTEVTTQ